MKKLLFSIILTFLFFPFQACAQDQHPPDIKRIIDRGKIIVAMLDEENPPFFMHDEKGDFVGLDVDLAHDIASKLGVQVEFNRKAKTYDGVVDIVFSGEADVGISNLSKTLERAKRVLFTDTYLTLYKTLVVNRLEAAQRRWGSDVMKALNDKNVKIGTLKESSYITFAQELFPLAIIVPYEKIEAAYNDARAGKVQAAFFDNIFTKGWHNDNPDAALYVQTIICKQKEDPIAMAVNWQDTHLYEWLNQYLAGVIKDGTVEKLVVKYLED